MSHSLEAVIREAYSAFGQGDLDGYLQVCTEDFTFCVAGRGGISGKYIGKHGLYELAGKALLQLPPHQRRESRQMTRGRAPVNQPLMSR